METVVCPVCREVCYLAEGLIQRHGSIHHGVSWPCSGSGTPFRCLQDCCDS